MASNYLNSYNNYVGNLVAQQIFAYIYDGQQLTPAITERFKKSLIVLGKEGQIYNPLTNTYIGIGETQRSNILSYIDAANQKIDALNTSLTASLVSGIYANWDAEDWMAAKEGLQNNIADQKVLGSIFATNNIVLKGDGNYDTTSQLRAKKYYANVDNSANTDRDLSAAYFDVDPNASVFADSGITVSLVKGEYEYKYSYSYDYEIVNGGVATGKLATWVETFYSKKGVNGIDEQKDFLSKDGVTTVTATLVKDSFNEPVFRNGKNVFTIDDKQTWSYIASAYAYTLNFAQDFTRTEVNRIYTEILGIGNNSTIPVSYAAINDLVINGETKVSNPESLAEYKLTPDVKVFRVVKADDHIMTVDRYSYQYGETHDITSNNAANIGILTSNVASNNGLTDADATISIKVGDSTETIYSFTKAQTAPVAGQYYADYCEGDKYTRNYVLQHIDSLNDLDASAEYVIINPDFKHDVNDINILDGIQTLKEVAYVLDTITNGDGDGAIELAYSIAENHKNILDLDSRLDAVEEGKTAVRSISNGADGNFVDLQVTSNIPDGGRFFGDVELKVDLDIAYTGSYVGTAYSVATRTPGDFNGADYETTFSEFNYSYTVDKSRNALVDVNWALAYGAELADVADKVAAKHAAEALAQADARVDALDTSYTALSDEFLDGFTQTNGLVTVTRKKLAQDKVVTNSVVWGETKDIHYTAFASANDITEAIASSAKIYVVGATKYEHATFTPDPSKTITVFGTETSLFVLYNGAYKRLTELVGDEFATLKDNILSTLQYGKKSPVYVQLYSEYTSYDLVDNADIVVANYDTYFQRDEFAGSKDYITAETHQSSHTEKGNGETTLHLTTHITKVVDATADNTGLVDAWDLRQTLANMFEWVDLSEFVNGEVNPLNRPGAVE